MSEHFLRFPPDSTGKRVVHSAVFELSYDGGTIDFHLNDLITLASSGVTGTVIDVVGSTGSGLITIILEIDSPSAAVDNEAIQVNNVTHALANGSGSVYYVSNNVITGATNPKNGLIVDNQGAGYVRFAEGSPQFDAFGHLQVSQQASIGEFVPTYDILPEHFTDTTSGTGNISHMPASSGILLSIGSTQGDSVKRISNKYFKYQSGFSHLIMMTIAAGDAGKAGLTRLWGYGDDDDGLFFKLEGTTLSVMSKSTSTGSPVSVVVPQSSWNTDKLDGSGSSVNLSRQSLDVTKDNIYFIDFQWLGAGRVRFGVVIDGVRIVCHSFNHANNVTSSYMRSGSLPLYISQENTSATGSTSELRVWVMSVFSEGLEFNPPEIHFSADNGSMVTVSSDTTYTHLFSGRAREQLNGLDNRAWIIPEITTIYVSGDPILLEMVKNPTLSNIGGWGSAYSNSGAEVAVGGNVAADGRSIGSWIVAAGVSTQNVEPAFSYDSELLTRKANIAATPDHYTFRAKTLEAGKTANVRISMNWKEVQ